MKKRSKRFPVGEGRNPSPAKNSTKPPPPPGPPAQKD